MKPLTTLAACLLAPLGAMCAPVSAASVEDAVRAADRAFWSAFDRCDATAMGAAFADDAEFYHDTTGLTVTGPGIVRSLVEGPCGSEGKRLRREASADAVRFDALAGGYALLSGEHRFLVSEGGRAERADSQARFVELWQRTSAGWRMRRVVSYAHAPQSPLPESTNGIELDAAQLAPYAGSYRQEDGGEMTVFLEGDALKLRSGPMTFTLVPQGGDRFAARERAVVFEFADALREVRVREAGAVVARARRIPSPPAVVVSDGRLQDALDRAVPQLLARYRVPAAAVAYIEHGKVVFTRVYGERRRGLPAGPDTLFNVASLTKPMTADILLRMASAGRIDLDEPMSRHWIDPDIADDPRAQRLTARMALRHRTGLPNWRNQTGNALAFVQDPDTGFRYGGEGYTYAATYAERKTGEPFVAAARQWLFGPLGMDRTTYVVNDALIASAAYPHDAQGRELWPSVRLDFSGACCLHTTIGDAARFMAAVMRDDGLAPAIARQRLDYGQDMRAQMCREDMLPPALCPDGVGMGLGWMVFRYGRDTIVNHTGRNDGERAIAWYIPERGIGLVVLTNGANGGSLIRDVSHAVHPNAGFDRLLDSLAR